MEWVVTIYSLIHWLATIIVMGVIFSLWNRRDVPGVKNFIWAMIAAFVFILCAALESMAVPLSNKILISQIQYLGSNTSPPFMLLFGLEYYYQKDLIKPWFKLLLFILPVTTIALAFTNQYHHLIWSGFTPGIPGSNLLVYVHGPAFYVLIAYVYLCLAATAVLVFRASKRFPRRFRRQSLLILIGLSIPLMGSVIYTFIPNFMPGFDHTPASFAITGILVTLGITREQLFALVPVARHRLVELMSDGLLVIDRNYRIIDLNPAAAHLLGIGNTHIGQSIDGILPQWDSLYETLANGSEGQIEVQSSDHGNKTFELRILSLKDENNISRGMLLLARDITHRKEMEEQVRRANDRLQDQLIEIQKLQERLQEQVIRDPLTGLYNRRYLDGTLKRELARAERDGYPVCILMFDLDHFKILNDTYGHACGDKVLEIFGQFLTARIRHSDIPCRYGGEEFLLVIPNCSADAGAARAEELRKGFEQIQINYGRRKIKTSFSIGVAAFPGDADTPDELIHAADSALYATKKMGGNRVAIANESNDSDTNQGKHT